MTFFNIKLGVLKPIVAISLIVFFAVAPATAFSQSKDVDAPNKSDKVALLSTDELLAVLPGDRPTVNSVNGVDHEGTNCELGCMVCDGLFEPERYEEGSLKALKMLVPGKGSWVFRSEIDFQNEFGIPTRYEKKFKKLIRTFNKQGTEIVMVVQPTRGLIANDMLNDKYDNYGFDYGAAERSFSNYLKQLERLGVVVPNTGVLIDASDPNFFFRRDTHWTPIGAMKTAEIVAEEIKNLKVYDALPKQEYETESSYLLRKRGTMNWGLDQICGNHLGFQTAQGYETFPVFSAEESDPFGGESESPFGSDIEDSDSPFGDEFADDNTDTESPPVVMVGTSNSATRQDRQKDYNFSGFLKEYTSLDINNYAIAGAGQYGALMEFLLSDDFNTNAPPKVMIWEVPANYRMDIDSMYREVPPALSGGCEKGTIVTKQSYKILPPIREHERVELLTNQFDQKVDWTAKSSFLEIDFSNKNIKEFYILTYFSDGTRDKVFFSRPAVVSGGRYFVDISSVVNKKNKEIISIFFEPKIQHDNGTDVEIKLCKF